ncbi:capsular biosynthesis protein [Bacillus sp. ISL-40]|uniref:YveK family protein n=1 Tax=unclassified Bacillus (in: firmicutes) TaxID=185979 RepID=UPI001BEB502E|nr:MULTISPECIES: Wzz/FepE/Etk N-terminal domain-containing protein [unclassified Bacillus (in: firmicutes)]MBT2701008.1 capsular biosynthesis protein [Bacillus sp. ISL-40]MBT2739336.1 capsular biosynthesis protein [Bacillus sp. ISL-77]
MEETISLKELLETLKKRLLLIVSITLIAGIVSGVVSYFLLTPIYQASTQILVNQAKNEQGLYNYNEVQTNLQLINTYNVIIKSPAILDKVVDELDLNMTTAQLNEKITVGSEKDSQVVNVAVQDPSAKVAAQIANKTAEVFKSEISKIMNVDNVSVLAKADITENSAPIKPRPLLNVAIAMVVGLMAGVGLSFLLEYFNNTIKNEQDVEKILGLPILGVIATIDDRKMEESVTRRAGRKSTVRGETLGS